MPRRLLAAAVLVLTSATTLTATLTTTFAPTATAAPAHAGRRTITDARHDVLKQVGDRAPRPAVHFRGADITTFVTTLRRSELVLTTSVRDLPKNYWAMLWQVRTDAGTLYDIDLLKTGTVRFQLSVAGAAVPCTMTRKVNPDKSRVTVSVPLSCLGEPGSVRTGAGAAATSRDFGRIWTDDALKDGRYSSSRLKLGNTVKRPG